MKPRLKALLLTPLVVLILIALIALAIRFVTVTMYVGLVAVCVGLCTLVYTVLLETFKSSDKDNKHEDRSKPGSL